MANKPSEVSKASIASQGDTLIGGDVAGRDVVKNIVFVLTSMNALDAGLDEKTVSAAWPGIQKSLRTISSGGNADDLVKVMFDGFRKSLSQQVSTNILKDIETIGRVMGPVLRAYQTASDSRKILPYADIVNDLLTGIGDYFGDLDAFKVLSNGQRYSVRTYRQRISTTRDVPMLALPFLSEIVANDRKVTDVFPQNYSYKPKLLLGRGEFTGSARVSSSTPSRTQARAQASRTGPAPQNSPITLPLPPRDPNVFSHLYVEGGSMSSPYLVVFDDQYFVGSDKRRLRIDVPVFSMFLFGLALDLVSYARKLSQENNLGRGAIEKLLTTDPGAGQGTNK